MPLSNNLRRQHDDILVIVNSIKELIITPKDIQVNGKEVSQTLRDLAGILKVHLEIEDKSVYPRLIESTDFESSLIATRFANEMGHIGRVFSEYLYKYHNSRSITENSHQFLEDSNELFKALINRIERENNELYKHFDKLI